MSGFVHSQFRFVYIKYVDLIATSEIFCNILFTLMSAFCLHNVFNSLIFFDKKPNDDTSTYNFLILTFKLRSSSRLQYYQFCNFESWLNLSQNNKPVQWRQNYHVLAIQHQVTNFWIVQKDFCIPICLHKLYNHISPA